VNDADEIKVKKALMLGQVLYFILLGFGCMTLLTLLLRVLAMDA